MSEILVVIDPTADAHPCLDRAIWLGKLYDANLHLFICDYDPFLAPGRFADAGGLKKARASLMQAHRQRLENLAEGAKKAGLSVSVDAVWDHPLDHGIVRKTLALRPLMLVKDTHYHEVLRRTVFSNTDWGLIRDCPAPLLLVKPGPLNDPVKLVAAVDPLHEHDKPAELDSHVLALAQRLAELASGELLVFHSFDPTSAIAGASSTLGTPIAVPVSEVAVALEKQHREAMDKLVASAGLESEQVRIHQGIPHQLLPKLAANEGVDIVVMGAVSRSGLKRVFIGHTAERVLDKLPCDLLIVKPPGFLSRVEAQFAA